MPDMSWKPFNPEDLMNGRALLWLNKVLGKLVTIGISDPQRFGLEGGSYGGYSTLAFITQTNRLRAVIADAGNASELSSYTEFLPNGDAFYVNQQERITNGTPWTSLKQYIDQSPLFRFDRVTTPRHAGARFRSADGSAEGRR